MGILSYLSGQPSVDPWIESKLDKNFVVRAIDAFHRVDDCMSCRRAEIVLVNRNENFSEQSRRLGTSEVLNTSSNRC